VQLTGRVSVVHDHELADRIDTELDAKYAVFRTPAAEMPEPTRRHYAGTTLLQFRPDARILSWDNRRLQLSR